MEPRESLESTLRNPAIWVPLGQGSPSSFRQGQNDGRVPSQGPVTCKIFAGFCVVVAVICFYLRVTQGEKETKVENLKYLVLKSEPLTT